MTSLMDCHTQDQAMENQQKGMFLSHHVPELDNIVLWALEGLWPGVPIPALVKYSKSSQKPMATVEVSSSLVQSASLFYSQSHRQLLSKPKIEKIFWQKAKYKYT